MPKKPFNGHESWNAWNVSLWIGNDESIYNLAVDCIRRPRSDAKPVSVNCATLRFFKVVQQGSKTPDGAPYSWRSVKLALASLMDDLGPTPAESLKKSLSKNDDTHAHQWGPFERSRIAGTVHRKCQVPECHEINLDGDDD